MKFGLLTYQTRNIGDVIQSIAAAQFLPSVDCTIDRDRLNGAREACKIILNGWHTHRPENWPPSPLLDPLLVSMHFTKKISPKSESALSPDEVLLSGASLEYFRARAPIGARDTWTLDLLRAKGIEAYFSGCLTLTLGTGEKRARQDYVCAVNLGEAACVALRQRRQGSVVVTSHSGCGGSFGQRVAHASQLLTLYASAKCVVTTKLHCALPCVALGTPVLLIVTARDAYRFSGLLDLVRHCTEEEFCAGAAAFDIDAPSDNSDAYVPYRDELIRTATAFVDGKAAAAPRKPFVADAPLDLTFASYPEAWRKTLRPFANGL